MNIIFNTAFKDAVVRKILKKSLVKEFIFSKNKTEGTTTKIPEVTYFLLNNMILYPAVEYYFLLSHVIINIITANFVIITK